MTSDSDQTQADTAHAAHGHPTAAQEQEFQRSRRARDDASSNRDRQAVQRRRTAADRVREGTVRDRTAGARDETAEARDDHGDKLLRAAQSRESALLAQLQELRTKAGAERARASNDRARAAGERARLLSERERLENELKAANWRFDALDAAVGADAAETPAHVLGDDATADDPVQRREPAMNEVEAPQKSRRA
jgi:hypothetical protein